jgi:hypothetical protein
MHQIEELIKDNYFKESQQKETEDASILFKE